MPRAPRSSVSRSPWRSRRCRSAIMRTCRRSAVAPQAPITKASFTETHQISSTPAALKASACSTYPVRAWPSRSACRRRAARRWRSSCLPWPARCRNRWAERTAVASTSMNSFRCHRQPVSDFQHACTPVDGTRRPGAEFQLAALVQERVIRPVAKSDELGLLDQARHDPGLGLADRPASAIRPCRPS